MNEVLNLDKVPGLRVEGEGPLTEEGIMQFLEPYQAGLEAISDDEAKKEWLQSKRPHLEGEELEQGHQRASEYAEEQAAELVAELGLSENVSDLLKAFYYVRGVSTYVLA